MDLQEKWDLKGPRAVRVLEELKGDAGDKGSQGAPGLRGPPGALGGNWKQCVFKNLNEGKDTGLIKVFFFCQLIAILQTLFDTVTLN